MGFVLWSNVAFGQAPEFIQEDFHANARELAQRIGAQITEEHPGAYDFDGYYVEV